MTDESVSMSDLVQDAAKMEVGKTYIFKSVRFEQREGDNGPYDVAFATQTDDTEVMTSSGVIVGQFRNPKVTELFAAGKTLKGKVTEIGKKPNQYYKLV